MHPTAVVEAGVDLGRGTAVWDNVHIRAPTRIGEDCIIGEKTYVAYGVEIGDRVKINAFVYVCNAVTLENGVMVGAGTVFTNDRFPRATDPDLAAPRPSEPGEDTRPTLVREGASIGARSVIGSDIVIGRWSMVGMGSVVTRSVPDFHLVVGHPARPVACVCRCGQPFLRFAGGAAPDAEGLSCPACDRRYTVRRQEVVELVPAPSPSPSGAVP